MYKNQYIISNSRITNIYNDFYENLFNSYYVYTHKDLQISRVENNNIEILLLGSIFDYTNVTKKNNEIIRDISNSYQNINQLIRQFGKYSGRYVVIIKVNNFLYMFSDTLGLRGIYSFNQGMDIFIASNPKMIYDFANIKFKVSDDINNYLKSKEAIKHEYEYFGEKFLDNRIERVLPNHYKCINNNKNTRIEFVENKVETYEELIRRASCILKGNILAITNRYNVIMPLTAGIDSRVLLSVTKKFNEKISFYMFFSSYIDSWEDIIIPRKISKRLNIKFNSIKVNKKADKRFIKKIKSEQIIFRELSKINNIEYHYYNTNKNTVNINGNGGEVLRGFYDYTSVEVKKEDLLNIVNNGIFNAEIDKYYHDVKKYCNDNGLSILDIFYWEQRMGIWGSWYPMEQDIAIEEFTPFNNRELIELFLTYRKYNSVSDDKKIFTDIINRNWKELNCFKINPKTPMGILRKIKRGLKVIRL